MWPEPWRQEPTDPEVLSGPGVAVRNSRLAAEQMKRAMRDDERRQSADAFAVSQNRRWYLVGLEGREFVRVLPDDLGPVIYIAQTYGIPWWLTEQAASQIQLAVHCHRHEAYARLVHNLNRMKTGAWRRGPDVQLTVGPGALVVPANTFRPGRIVRVVISHGVQVLLEQRAKFIEACRGRFGK